MLVIFSVLKTQLDKKIIKNKNEVATKTQVTDGKPWSAFLIDYNLLPSMLYKTTTFEPMDLLCALVLLWFTTLIYCSSARLAEVMSAAAPEHCSINKCHSIH